MAGSHRKEGRPKYGKVPLRKTTEEMLEENVLAASFSSLLRENKWMFILGYALLWIIKLVVESRGDFTTALAISSITNSIVISGLSMIVAWVGLLSLLFLSSSLGTFYNLKVKGEDDTFKHVLLILASLTMAFVSASIVSLVIFFTLVLVVALIAVSMKKIVRRKGLLDTSSDRHVTTTNVLVQSVAYAVTFLMIGGMWLPPENIKTTDGNVFVGYMLESDNDNTTLLIDHTRVAKIYKNDLIENREICSKASSSNWWNRTFLYVLNSQHEGYPKCHKVN